MDLLERYVDGLALEEDIAAAYQEAGAAAAAACRIESGSIPGGGVFAYPAKDAAWSAASAAADALDFGPLRRPQDVAKLAADSTANADAEAAIQAAILREMIGNPFRHSPPLPTAVLAWNDRTIPRLAAAIYEDRQMPKGTLDPSRLAILADALLDAGGEAEDLIQHLRGPGPHYAGCWAVDRVLGKE